MTLYRVRKCMRGLGVRGVTPNAKKRITIPDEGAPPKPDLVARDLTGPVPTYRLAGDITYLRTGQGWLSPATAVDPNTRMVVGWACVWAHGRRHSPPALELARRRGYVAEGPSFTATAAASTPRGRCAVGQGRRRGALVRPHRQPPRQRGSRVLLRDPQKRDVLPPPVSSREEARLAVTGFIESSTTAGAPPDNRLQGAGRRDGRVLRALRGRVVGAEGGVASGINPGFFVSEILTQVRSLSPPPS